MDPDTTLADALALARAVADGRNLTEAPAANLAEAVLALDEWLAKGGYLPARWRGTDGTTIPSGEAPERRRDTLLGADGQPLPPAPPLVQP